MQAHQSTQLNLGTISAVSVDHNWTLEANLSVQLRARHNTPLPSSTDLLAHLKTQSAWVSRGNGLNLVVEIDPVLQLDCDAEQRRLVSALRNAVANADFWKQLDLDVSPVNSPISATSLHENLGFVLGIRHSSSLQQDGKKRLHRLAVGESAADLTPPGAVEVVELVGVVVGLRFRCDGHDRAQRGNEEGEIRPAQAQHVEHAVVAEDIDMLGMDEPPSSPLLLPNSPPTSISTPPQPHPPNIGTTAPQPSSPSTIDIPSALSLLDTTLRSLICPRPSKLPLGIWLPRPTIDLPLSALAPSLFCPGYAKAVAERACFLPTIAHALAHSLPRRARSRGLREKLAAFNLSDGQQAVGEISGITSLNLVEVVKARLWRTVQRGLFRHEDARGLTPLRLDEEDGDVSMADHLTTVPLRARITELARPKPTASAVLPSSPILLGSLATDTQQEWDGGLLAQSVRSDLLLSRMLRPPSSVQADLDEDENLADQEYGSESSVLNDHDEDYDLLYVDNLLDDSGGLWREYEDDEESLLLCSDVDEDEISFNANDSTSLLLESDALLYSDGSLLHDDDENSSLLQDEEMIFQLEASQDDEDDVLMIDDEDDPAGSQDSTFTAMTVYSNAATSSTVPSYSDCTRVSRLNWLRSCAETAASHLVHD